MADIDDQAPRHVRNDRETLKRFGLLGQHPQACVAWCGEDATNEWVFVGIDHVVMALVASTCITPCRACLKAIANILHEELGNDEDPDS